MFVSECLDVNEEGNLTIGGCDTTLLAKEYGTPLYVMDEATIRKSASLYRESIDQYYGGNGLVLYASKALSCKEIFRIAKDENLGIDVTSGGEIYTALEAGFPASKMYFHGNNKTAEELNYALDSGVGRIVVDNLEELELLDRLSAAKGKVADILLRIKPGVDAHTHNFIKTGQIDSKFGIAIETGEAALAVEKAVGYKNVNLIGTDCHIGSQIFDIEPFELTAEIMLNFIAEIKAKYGVIIKELDLGGGFGTKYLAAHDPVAYNEYMGRVAKVVKNVCAKKGIDTPYILIEPGRTIVASAGITLYTVGSVKEIPGVRTYVSVDGGMTDNPRYALYCAEYDALIANKATQPKVRTVTIAGKCCESGDLLQENIAIQEPRAGDILAVLVTGAYNYSMASNYNRFPRPAMVMIKDGKPRLIVRRETYEDLVRNDV
jgi:diaminopimelate decarboxylase